MTDAQRALCVANIKLVPHCVKKFLNSGIEWDELCASGNLGLACAAATYSPERGQFATYAGVCIDNEVYKLLRKRRKHSKVVASLDDEIAGGEKLHLHEAVSDGIDWAERAENNLLVADVVRAVSALPTRPRRMWELRLGLTGESPLNQKEIAERMGCSRGLVCKALKRSQPQIQGALRD